MIKIVEHSKDKLQDEQSFKPGLYRYKQGGWHHWVGTVVYAFGPADTKGGAIKCLVIKPAPASKLLFGHLSERFCMSESLEPFDGEIVLSNE